jgi:hypothetical protein
MRISIALLTLAACHGGGTPAAGPADGAIIDGAVVDSAPIADDAAAIDAAATDAAAIDAAAIDARPGAPDARPLPDAHPGMPDARMLADARPRPDAAPPPPDARPQPPGLALVSMRTLPAHFLLPHTITADDTRIYVAGVVTTGNCELFVLARDRAADFPLLQTIALPSCGLGVAGIESDATDVRVATKDGKVYDYAKAAALTLRSTYALTPYAEEAAWSGNDLILSEGTGTVAASPTRVFVHTLNNGDHAQAFALPALPPGTSYLPAFDVSRIAVFDRASGTLLATMPAMLDDRGDQGAVSMEAGDGWLAEFVAGCCGDRVEVYDPITLVRTATVYFSTDSVAWSGPYLVLGSEGSVVSMWDLRGPYPLAVGWADLRQLTGHTRIDDFEVRAIYSDDRDRLIFGATSWNYSDLPSFIVLERTGD